MEVTTFVVDDAALRRHSFDLVHFPMYLAQRVAPRVRVEFVDDSVQADLMGLHADVCGVHTWKFAKLVADPEGIRTNGEAFFHAVHAAFAHGVGEQSYLGFTRAGSPVYAPLFALAMLYRKYGRGLYEANQTLPTPYPALTASYSPSI